MTSSTTVSGPVSLQTLGKEPLCCVLGSPPARSRKYFADGRFRGFAARDTRRAELSGGSKVLERSTVDPRAEEGGAAAAAEPITPGKPFRYAGKLRSIVDNDNNGYTI